MKEFKYKGYRFQTEEKNLGGKCLLIRILINNYFKFAECKNGYGKFSKKDLDRIINNFDKKEK